MKKLSLFSCIVFTLACVTFSGCSSEQGSTNVANAAKTSTEAARDKMETKSAEINTNRPGGPRESTEAINTNRPGGPRERNGNR